MFPFHLLLQQNKHPGITELRTCGLIGWKNNPKLLWGTMSLFKEIMIIPDKTYHLVDSLNYDFATQLYFVSHPDATSFEDVSPQGNSDDSSTGSRIHGKICT